MLKLVGDDDSRRAGQGVTAATGVHDIGINAPRTVPGARHGNPEMHAISRAIVPFHQRPLVAHIRRIDPGFNRQARARPDIQHRGRRDQHITGTAVENEPLADFTRAVSERALRRAVVPGHQIHGAAIARPPTNNSGGGGITLGAPRLGGQHQRQSQQQLQKRGPQLGVSEIFHKLLKLKRQGDGCVVEGSARPDPSSFDAALVVKRVSNKCTVFMITACFRQFTTILSLTLRSANPSKAFRVARRHNLQSIEFMAIRISAYFCCDSCTYLIKNKHGS